MSEQKTKLRITGGDISDLVDRIKVEFLGHSEILMFNNDDDELSFTLTGELQYKYQSGLYIPIEKEIIDNRFKIEGLPDGRVLHLLAFGLKDKNL
jgi:hypothetical protein